MTVADDLATLRQSVRFSNAQPRLSVSWECNAALDRVEAEIARLEERDRILTLHGGQQRERAEAADAKVARLRDGLRRIRGISRDVPVKREIDALLAEDDAARDERCDKCGLPRDAHPGRLFCPAPGGAA